MSDMEDPNAQDPRRDVALSQRWLAVMWISSFLAIGGMVLILWGIWHIDPSRVIP